MKRLPLVLAVVGVLLAAPAASVIAFEEIAERSGLIFTTNSCPTPNKNQPETMVAGVALLDYDNDGYLDVYLVNGAAIPSLKKESPKYWNRLFHNNRDGTFTDVTEKAGVAGEGYGMGVAVGDFDNDGWPDLYVVNVTEESAFPQQPRRHIHRCHGPGARGRRHARRQEDVVRLGRLARLQQRRVAGFIRLQLLQVGGESEIRFAP